MALTSLNASTNALANYTSLTSNTAGSGVKDNSSKTQETQTNTSGAKPANSASTPKVKEAQSPAVVKSISADAWNYSSTPSTASSPSTYAPAYDATTGQPPGREGESQSVDSASPASPPPTTPTPNASANALAAYTSLMATVFEGAKNSAATIVRTGESSSTLAARTSSSGNSSHGGAKTPLAQQNEAQAEQLGAGWSRNADGTLKYESNLAAQLVVPGRIPLDGMFTDAANGNYVGAVINLATAAIEDAVFVLTLGASQAKTAGTKMAQLGAKNVAQAGAPVAAKEAAKSVDPRLIGTFDPPVGIKFGTTTFGQYAHREAAAIVKQDLAMKGVPKVVDRTAPGTRGVDLSVPPEFAPRLGYEHLEIKPDTVSGLSSYNRSVAVWGYDPSTVRPVTYDGLGNVFWGFTR